MEDEISYRNVLQKYIIDYQKERNVDIEISLFGDGEDIALEYKGGYDIIMMDIQMKFMDGMTAAEKIRSNDEEVIIIFITNMTDYALKGYTVNAMDYLVKPVSYFALQQRLDKAIKQIGSRMSRYISIGIKGGIKKIDISSIFYIESQGHNLRFVTEDGEYTSRLKMQDMDEKLDSYGFFRAGKGFLINMKKVTGIENNTCLIHKEAIPISRGRKNEFMESMLKFMNEDSI